MTTTIAIAMSGGVDSSTAAVILKEQGYNLFGLFMKTGTYVELPENSKTCCSVNDARDAALVAEKLGIPFYVLDYSDNFKGLINYFCKEYNEGHTPNPCVVCNEKLKFKKMLDHAKSLGADYIATGHYALVEEVCGEMLLKKGNDPKKDQSYFLARCTKEQLKYIMFPLGKMSKEEVRKKAESLDLRVKNKPDSQEICFVPDNNYRNLLKKHSPQLISSGDFVSETGEYLGKHKGYQMYTIGQRRGLEIALGKPYYVAGINPLKNEVALATREHLYKNECLIYNVNYIGPKLEKKKNMKLDVQIRYNHQPASAMVEMIENNKCKLLFDTPQFSITPGQLAVAYKNNTVILSGWIS